MTLRIVLADDHGVLADSLRALLDREPDMEVVGAVRNGADAVQLAVAMQPHVIVMDVSMPGMNGIDATRRILAAQPGAKVLCLSMHLARRFGAGARAAGAAGYLAKDCAAEELVRAVRTVARGQSYLSPSIASLLVEALTGGPGGEDDSATGRLTAREREVLQLLAEGHSAKDIAQRLQVSIKTVGTHREHIKRKLGIDSIAGLTKYAIREGLTTDAVDPTA